MKNITIVVLVVLLAIGGYVIVKDRSHRGEGPPPATGDISVQPLSPEAEKALGITKDDALVTITAADGSMKFLYPSGWKPSDGQAGPLPDHPVNALSLEPMTTFIYSGSPICVLVRIGGKWVKVCQ